MHTDTHRPAAAPFPLVDGPAGYFDISEPALDAGFRLPTYMSPGVYQILAWDDALDCARKHCYEETLDGRIWSVLWMAVLAVQKYPHEESAIFSCRIIPQRGSSRQSETERFRIRCDIARSGEPILTITTPWED
ncbi:DUF6573 family protein [Acidithiobacillus caldus]|uniref:Uncharacterized protein n=2 Tax=Acidithiobacillus caldus TaxID=33059 RepID=F9ZRY4_ACICS|nr:DUF6573 family protein [Acidithiobacillus caldus]AEK58769.1 conserved hypothetical protein [Acidithiobacillus caldus SM-1]OFC35521.1 hypothetical protein BAE29_15320 [Acidithiobacillus caldus]OFC36370.1 hypothetical protein BAE27_06220 [Acidithiobacillus caldus]OFC40436.1 hypothetical protein BAE28_00040 [Acidithiobacillus caldus]OFC62427.1 hypothetical protein BAE30_01965 [Acidithiobacillus caldus]